VSLETCWAIKKHWNNKFYYTVASCWLFLYDLYYNARIHEYQALNSVLHWRLPEEPSKRRCGITKQHRPELCCGLMGIRIILGALVLVTINFRSLLPDRKLNLVGYYRTRNCVIYMNWLALSEHWFLGGCNGLGMRLQWKRHGIRRKLWWGILLVDYKSEGGENMILLKWNSGKLILENVRWIQTAHKNSNSWFWQKC